MVSVVKLSREDRSDGAQMNSGSNKSPIMDKAGS